MRATLIFRMWDLWGHQDFLLTAARARNGAVRVPARTTDQCNFNARDESPVFMSISAALRAQQTESGEWLVDGLTIDFFHKRDPLDERRYASIQRS